MADTTLLAKLRGDWSVTQWNSWRQDNKIFREHRDRLSGLDLSRAPLCNADLSYVDLSNAHLADADLRGARLTNANLVGADLSRAILDRCYLTNSDLSASRLVGATGVGAQFFGANLRGADLSDADFSAANLSGADLSEACLSGAQLKAVSLIATMLNDTQLSKTNVSHSTFLRTVLANVDLRTVIGLATCTHLGPSTVGIDTLYRSEGIVDDSFLIGAGVPNDVMEFVLPSIRSGPAIQWYSCFISYSTRDDDFVRRLYSRMKDARLRVWFAPEDLQGGKKLHEQLFEAIQLHDRLLLVLSDSSIKSEWVITEIRKAREVERREHRRKLFPIRLVDFDTLRAWTCIDADTGKDLAVEVREYFIPDFSDWMNHDAFDSAFSRLLADLKSSEPRSPL